jgi:hypothetical protein
LVQPDLWATEAVGEGKVLEERQFSSRPVETERGLDRRTRFPLSLQACYARVSELDAGTAPSSSSTWTANRGAPDALGRTEPGSRCRDAPQSAHQWLMLLAAGHAQT